MGSKSKDRPIDDALSLGLEVLSNDALDLRQPVEWNLWEQVVLSLELHASHQHQPPEVLLRVVPARDDLVINKAHIHFLVDAVLPFVVPN